MISFDSLDTSGGGPIYLRIIDHIKKGVAAGSIADGDELPSRRVLSALLGVNPNTVQKAYALLEEEGLIRSRSGAKSFVSLEDGGAERVRRELTESAARAAAAELRGLGLTLEKSKGLLEKYWEEEKA